MVSAYAGQIINMIRSIGRRRVQMSREDAVSGQAIQQPQGRGSRCDINRKSDEHWHLHDPHNKALAALCYTSLLKGAWEMAVRSRESLLSFRRNPNRVSIPVARDRNVTAS